MSWKWEMYDEGKWISNAVRFATKKEADSYGLDLAMRWTGMPADARSAESNDPVSYHIVDGVVKPLATV